MTYPSREHEELLRRALRVAADSVEPAGDGLERIRVRLSPPRPAFAAWMMSATEPVALRLRPLLAWLRLRTGLALAWIGPALGRIGPALTRIAPALGRIGPALGRIAPALTRIGPALGRAGTAIGRIGPVLGWRRAGNGWLKVRPAWLRPAAAMAAFVVIIG